MSTARLHPFFLLAAALTALTGCAGLPPLAAPVSVIAPAPARPMLAVRLDDVAADLAPGVAVGEHRWNLRCAGPFTPVTWRWRADDLKPALFDAGFRQALETAGFEALADPERAEFAVTARIIEARVDLCRRAEGQTGDGRVRVAWTVAARPGGHPLYRLTTEGRAATDEPSPGGDEAVLRQAFRAAAGELGRDAGFLAAVRAGTVAAAGAVADGGPPPLMLRRRSGPPRAGVAAAVVTVGRGNAGVFIDDDLVLTSLQAVGGAELVTVRRRDGQTVAGAVLRRDVARDLALVRVPAGRVPAVLPVREHPPAVSDAVRALMPSGGGAVAEGIVSMVDDGGENGAEGLGIPAPGGGRLLVDLPPVGAGGAVVVDAGGRLIGLAPPMVQPLDAGGRTDSGLVPVVPAAALAGLGIRIIGGAGGPVPLAPDLTSGHYPPHRR